MGKIIAIGGGEIGRPGYPVETTRIDKEIIRLPGQRHPKLLFVPTASGDAAGYIKAVKKHFGARLGCRVANLLLVKKAPTKTLIQKMILGSDIIYVGGGHTGKMLKIWRRYGVDNILRQAYRRGIVLSGLSAGAICWFRYGLSDWGQFQEKNKVHDYKRLRGLGLINLTVSPHHWREKRRRAALIKIMKRTPGVGLALDDCAALEIIDDKYRIITSKFFAKVHKVYFGKGKLYYKPLRASRSFSPLNRL